ADRKVAGLEEPLADADLGGSVANVLEEDGDLDDVGERAAGPLDREADVPPHLFGLGAGIASADDAVLLVEGDLAGDIEGVAAADRMRIGLRRCGETVGLEMRVLHRLLLGRRSDRIRQREGEPARHAGPCGAALDRARQAQRGLLVERPRYELDTPG